MENTPTVCGGDLRTILIILKNDRKSRSVNNCFQPVDLDPNLIYIFFYQPKLRPDNCSHISTWGPKTTFSELGLPGGRIVPLPRRSISHATKSSVLPYYKQYFFRGQGRGAGGRVIQ
jgi:hypothetical protein